MMKTGEISTFYKTFCAAFLASAVFALFAVCIRVFMPKGEEIAFENEIPLIEAPVIPAQKSYEDEVRARAQNVAWIENKDCFDTFNIESFEAQENGCEALRLYRDPKTRAEVEWFYLRVTGNRDVTMAILEAANREDIPFSLAFALCYTESRYNRFARNVNLNGSIDRGIFQLNDRSFPALKNDDFYVPETSAKYGMRHLRYCLDVSKDDTMALAMYNAGITRVKNDQTPRSTLRYVGKIAAYRASLDAAFAREVLSAHQ